MHQAEDEIAACAFAIGASYAGKCTVTITSGPGYSLKQEGIGLAVMGEIPLVVVNVQRGGPSTGSADQDGAGRPDDRDLRQPRRRAQGGDGAGAPSRTASTPIITARKIAETFNMVVVVLSDATLATSQQPFPRPVFSETWMAPPVDQSAVPEGARPYDWDAATGLARRFIPGQPGGMHTLTGLAHDRDSHVAYDADSNEQALRARSLKLAALQKTLTPPPVFGEPDGRPAGGRLGQHARAPSRRRSPRCAPKGARCRRCTCRFLQPLPPGIKEDHAAASSR